MRSLFAVGLIPRTGHQFFPQPDKDNVLDRGNLTIQPLQQLHAPFPEIFDARGQASGMQAQPQHVDGERPGPSARQPTAGRWRRSIARAGKGSCPSKIIRSAAHSLRNVRSRSICFSAERVGAWPQSGMVTSSGHGPRMRMALATVGDSTSDCSPLISRVCAVTAS